MERNERNGDRRISRCLSATQNNGRIVSSAKPSETGAKPGQTHFSQLGHVGTDTPDIPDSGDDWSLEFHPFGTTLPAALIGMTTSGGRETRGVVVVNGKQVC